MKRTRNEKGITLVALIITIIVLLILAVVSIRAVQGDGIIEYAKNAKSEYELAQANEQNSLNYLEEYLKEKVTGITNIYVKLYDDGTLTLSANNETIKGKNVVQDLGNIKEKNYNNATDTPWNNVRENITKVEILTEIVPTSTAYWFSEFTNLVSINNISNINTSKVTTMRCMFEKCEKLTSLDLSTFNTENVTNMSYMFSDCVELSSLNVKNFNTISTTLMHGMFYNCEKLASLDLSTFNTSKVTRIEMIFKGCKMLTTIFASDLFVVGENTSDGDMFQGCVNLVGGNGTAYTIGNHAKSFANIDTADNPGYFTLKVDE